ncbi:hypothetical protein B0H11DRAFT_1899290 [Mycena galericulata]|nr:hypothetical protein B0H11DRAFT_1899290 [Mycena galericulata]
MPRGRKPLDPQVKAEHRRETLRRYADRNKLALREAARIRMKRTTALKLVRSAGSVLRLLTPPKLPFEATPSSLLPDIEKETARPFAKPTQKYIEKDGAEAFDEKTTRKLMAKTQHRNEGRPPLRRPRPPIAQPERRRASSTEPSSDNEREARTKPPPKPLPQPSRQRAVHKQSRGNKRHVSSSPEHSERDTPPPPPHRQRQARARRVHLAPPARKWKA